MAPTIHESMEDYLESILMIRKEKGICYSIDVVKHRNVSRPSVSIAVKKLIQDGYVIKKENGELILTETGKKIASDTLEKHLFFKDMLTHMGVSEETAEKDACEIEHRISNETYQMMKEHVKFHI